MLASQDQSPVRLVCQFEEDASPNGVGPETFVANGQLWESTGDIDKAMESYTKALEREPNNVPALTCIARLHFRQGKHKQAAEFFQRAIAHNPQDAGLHNDLGLAFCKLGDHGGAIKSLEKALELVPGTSRYANNLASTHFEAGDRSSAFQALADNSKPAVAHFNMAYLYFKHDLTNAAKEHLSQSLRFESKVSDDTAVRNAVERSRELLTQIEASEGRHETEESTPEDGPDGIDDVGPPFPKATFEYKVISKKQSAVKLQAKLNRLGSKGWELCGRVGKQMILKRMSGFEKMEMPGE